MGTVVLYQLTMQLLSSDWATIPYFSISLPLNILLTLMIVIRLVLHTRNIRTAMGGAGTGGLCKAIVTMFIESCAINAVTSLLALVLFSTKNDAMVISLYILPMTQVRAFSRPESSDRSPNNLTTGRTDHRSIVCHSSSRQQECIDEQHSRLRTYQHVRNKEPRGVDGWQWCCSWWGPREFHG